MAMSKIEMHITYTPDGMFNMTCNAMNNKGLCYGVLQLAIDAVREYHLQQGAGGVKLEGLGLIDTGKKS